MNHVIVQIYGIRTPGDALMAARLGADHLGVCYGRVKRVPGQLSPEEAKEIFDSVGDKAVRIGLTVSEDIDEITEDLRAAMPDVLHLSGDIEGISPNQVAELRGRFPALRIMQAIPVLQNVPLTEQKALGYVKDYEAVSDFFLIDTKAASATDIGATGLTHDWAVDRAIVESTSVPCIIAGGLDADNVKRAVEVSRPYGADSYTHTNLDAPPAGTKAVKDPEKIKAFVEAVRSAAI